MTNSQVTTESGGRQNMFPAETRPYIDDLVHTLQQDKLFLEFFKMEPISLELYKKLVKAYGYSR